MSSVFYLVTDTKRGLSFNDSQTPSTKSERLTVGNSPLGGFVLRMGDYYQNRNKIAMQKPIRGPTKTNPRSYKNQSEPLLVTVCF